MQGIFLSLQFIWEIKAYSDASNLRVKEIYGFIKNILFWDDCFTSMMKWSYFLTTNDRLAWVSCWGVSLSCWCSSFFKNLSHTIEEPLLIEEEIVLRRRLDRRRIPMLIPFDKPCMSKIKVETTGNVF